jgi:hypothetical protein
MGLLRRLARCTYVRIWSIESIAALSRSRAAAFLIASPDPDHQLIGGLDLHKLQLVQISSAGHPVQSFPAIPGARGVILC